MPSFTLNMDCTCHPLATAPATPVSDFPVGTCQIPLMTKVLPMLKSDTPRRSLLSNATTLDMEFENLSALPVPELLSMLLLHVNEPWTWKPWVMFLVTPAS